MRVGQSVLYKQQEANIVAVKWGLCCIEFLDTRKRIWVSVDALTKMGK
jgi:hypothetical protein